MERQVAYRSLADSLRSAIRRGQYDNGQPLPTELQLAKDHGLSRQTVRRALQDLVSEGSVYRVAGRGTFALPKQDRFISDFASVEELLTLAPLTRCEIIAGLRIRRNPESARMLRLDGQEVCTLTLRRFNGVVPIGITRVAVPPAIGEMLGDMPELRTKGPTTVSTIIGIIERHRPGLVAATEQTVSATSLPAEVRRLLGGRSSRPALRVDRLYLDADNNPIEFAVNHFDAAQYMYRVRLQRHAAR